MLIECRKRRKPTHVRPEGGSVSKLGTRTYHFMPRPELKETAADPQAHVCNVQDEAHQAIFLAIPEAYNKFGKPPAIPAPPAAVEAAGQPPVTIELIDDDDKLGEPDAVANDPLAGAKAAQAEWIEEMLNKPTKTIAKTDLSELDDDLLTAVLEAEQAGESRVTVSKLIAAEQAIRAEKAAK